MDAQRRSDATRQRLGALCGGLGAGQGARGSPAGGPHHHRRDTATARCAPASSRLQRPFAEHARAPLLTLTAGLAVPGKRERPRPALAKRSVAARAARPPASYPSRHGASREQRARALGSARPGAQAGAPHPARARVCNQPWASPERRLARALVQGWMRSERVGRLRVRPLRVQRGTRPRPPLARVPGAMVRFHWPVEGNQSAFMPPGAIHLDGDVCQIDVEMEVSCDAAQRERRKGRERREEM